ncbi:MAG: putative Large exoprotein involved in heme utilization or adhesion, partial [Comamonadaceae bacterium]
AISGLTTSTAYKIYFVAKDAANNVQTSVQSIAVTTTAAAPDVTAPTTTAAPSVSGTSTTDTALSVTINEAGTGYYLVQPAAAAAPTVAQVQAGTAFAITANTAATQAISGLTASTAYKIYFVAKDAAGNVQAAVQSVAVTTAAPVVDVTAPTTTGGPGVLSTTDTATTLSVTINEAGTGYYLVKAAAAAAPTVAEVQAGTSFAMTANTAATPAISGLKALTAYKIYFVAKDAAGNVQATVQTVRVTTSPDLTPPTTTDGPRVSIPAGIDALLSATINEDGTGYYLVKAAAAAAPTVAEVQAGSSFEMFANEVSVIPLPGLTASTAYKVYFVAKNTAGNVQATVQSVAFTTMALDLTPPITTVAPSASGTTDTATTVSVTINKDGYGYYLLQAADAPAPSVAAVMSGGSLHGEFSLNANVSTSKYISGLTPSTAYKFYFVARDFVGNQQATVSAGLAITTMADTTPNAFDIANLTNQALSTVVTTNAMTVASISVAVTASTTAGTLVKNGVDTGLASTSVVAGDTVAVKLTTSGAFNTAINGTLTIGTGATNSDSFSVTTLAIDTIPDAFAFTDVTGQSVSTLVESNAITVAGINAAAAISVTGGEYSINGGAFTNAAGTVNNGQTVKVRHTTRASNGTATNTVLTIGGVTDTFTSTTVGSLPAGYISQGGLTWMPNNIGPFSSFLGAGSTDWNTANTYCNTTTINGETGWRLPTQTELMILYDSGLLAGQGWSVSNTWTSTPDYVPGRYGSIVLGWGTTDWIAAGYTIFVTCVR